MNFKFFCSVIESYILSSFVYLQKKTNFLLTTHFYEIINSIWEYINNDL